MPYVKRGATFRRRGMGDATSGMLAIENAPVNAVLPFASACNWWDVACWTGLDTLLSGQVPQNPNASGPQSNLPSIPPPSGIVGAGSTVPGGVPAGYDSTTGLEYQVVPAGQLPVLEPPAAYAPIYPNAPGGNVGSAGNPPGTCNWTQASWLDVTTWCETNWLLAGVVLIGGAVMIKGALK